MPPHLEGEMNMNLKHGQRSPVPEGARRGSPKEMGKGPEIDLKKKKKEKKDFTRAKRQRDQKYRNHGGSEDRGYLDSSARQACLAPGVEIAGGKPVHLGGGRKVLMLW